MSVSDIVQLSRLYGGDPEWVLAGGGNTSFKSDEVLFIKASGFPLATITEKGFARMSRAALQRIWTAAYPAEIEPREAAALADLMAARLPGEEKRPSVETLMHELFPYKLVVHTHPALVNGLTCALDGEQRCRSLFGDRAMWVPAIEPGYVLAREMRAAAARYAERAGYAPRIVLLQNHGLVVAAETPEEIRRLQSEVVDTVRRALVRTPDTTPHPAGSAPGSAVISAHDVKAWSVAIGGALGASVVSGTSVELEARLASRDAFNSLLGAFTPDHIVYAGSAPLYLPTDDPATLAAALSEYRRVHPGAPRIVAVRGVGVFAAAESHDAADTAYQLFTDQVKIAAYAESFGGARHLDPHLVAFIESWEVERYRKKMSTGGA